MDKYGCEYIKHEHKTSHGCEHILFKITTS